MQQTKKAKHIKLALIAVLIVVFIVFVFTYANITITPEGSVSHPDPVLGIIIDLRNLRAAADIFLSDNSDKQVTKLKLAELAHNLEGPSRFTETPGEYLLEEVNGRWWVGYNLTATKKYSEDRETIYEKLTMIAHKTIYGSMDISVPYLNQDIVYMPVR